MAHTQEITIGRWYPAHAVTVDGDEGPVTIAVRARRMTSGELAEFREKWAPVEMPESERYIYRLPDDDGEHEKIGLGYVVPAAEIRRRRIAEMDADTRQRFDALERRESVEHVGIAAWAVGKYLAVAPKFPDGQPFRLLIADDAGETRQAKTGADLVELFGGNLQTLIGLAGIVLGENVASAEKKTRSRGPSDSNTGSASVRPGPGESPAETAVDAAPAGTAASGDA